MVKQKGNPHAAKSNDFISAVRDIKKLTFESLSAKEKRIENKNKAYKQKNAKMPIFMLKGIRNKAVERYKQREEELREGQVLYDSSMKKFDMSWLENKQKKREKSKKKHEYNSYKFSGAKSQGLGKYSNGVLSFSKTQIRKITGGNKEDKGGKGFKGGKGGKGFKGKK